MLLSSVAPLLFLLHFPPVVTGTAVTGCHGDRDTDHRPRQNCTAAGFVHVPSGIEPSTQVLLFPLNRFSDLSWSSFTDFTEIHEIDLSQNQISALAPSDAAILPSLSVLHLGSNQLRAVPDHCFSASPALTKLYLQNNVIISLTDHSFSGLLRLEHLDLSNNHIQTLPERMMFPLTSIKFLFLEANKIKEMPDGWFSQKKEVHYLLLSANPWACSCSGSYLQTYLGGYEHNVYVRDGPIYTPNAESVVCDSPQSLKAQPVIEVLESNFCNDETTTAYVIPATTTTATTTTATTTVNTPTVEKYVTQSENETFPRFVEWSDPWESLRGDGRTVKKTTVPPKTEPPTTTLPTFPTTRHQTSTKTEPPTTTLPTFPTTRHQTSTKTEPPTTTLPTFPTTRHQTSTKTEPPTTTLPTFPTTRHQTSTKTKPPTTTLPTFPTTRHQTSTKTEPPTTTLPTFPTTRHQTTTKTEPPTTTLPTFPTTRHQTSTKTEPPTTTLPTFPTTRHQTSTKTKPPTTTLPTFPTTRHQTSTKTPTETAATTISTLETTKTTPVDATSDISTKTALKEPETYTLRTFDATETQSVTVSTLGTTSTDTIVAVSTISNAVLSGEVVSTARGVFCFWLFAGCVFLCVVLAVSSLMTAVRLCFWYRGVYKSLKCVIAGKKQVRMIADKQAQARYRTMLFVAKDAKEAECFVSLGPKDGVLGAGNVEESVYKQTMHRVITKEQEIEAKEVLAESGASREARKRYSVILREVREKDGGEAERCDWVVGGWEAEEKGAGHGDSWGAWLGGFLPSMPWGVRAPPRSEAESEERGFNETGEK